MAKNFSTFEMFLEAYRAGEISQTSLIHDMKEYPRNELESFIVTMAACQKDNRDEAELKRKRRAEVGTVDYSSIIRKH